MREGMGVARPSSFLSGNGNGENKEKVCGRATDALLPPLLLLLLFLEVGAD